MTDIVFDIGGTNTRVAAVHDGDLGSVTKFPTPADPEEGISAVATHVHSLLGGGTLGRVCGGVAGSIVEGVVVGANNLLLWNGAFIVDDLSHELGVPVFVLNDAELAGIGESHYGAGKGFRRFLYVTVSTGVGKARIVDGAVVQEDDPLKVSQELIDLLDLEHSVSGTAVKNRYNVDPRHLTDHHVLDSLADTLAQGLTKVVEEWKPDLIVLGGSMILGTNAIPLARVQQHISVPIKKAALGDHSGLYGAMAYLRMTAG